MAKIGKREKILLDAERLVIRGKLDAAVKEYRRALEQNPNDTNTLNRLGDLLVRVDRISEAIDVYQKIAKHFSEDGFFLKSIAIYKKINRLDPQRTETYERLADLYFKQGLAVEGRQQLITLADWFIRSRDLSEAVRVYRRLAELEPTNFQARAKLIDLLVQLGDVGTVAEEMDPLGRALLGRGMLDEAVKLYYRAIELSPPDGNFVVPCIEALVAAERHSQAAELATKALEATKGGVELGCAATRAFVEAGDLQKARRLAERLLDKAGERSEVLQVYCEVLLRSGEASEAKARVLPAVDRMVEAGDKVQAGGLLKRLLRAVPGDIEVLERAQRTFDRRDEPDLRASIEASLADAYYRAEKREQALELYQELAKWEPDNKQFRDRLVALGGRPPAPPARPEPAPPPAPKEPLEDRPALRSPELKAAMAELPGAGEMELEFVDVEVPDEPSGYDTGEVSVTEAEQEISFDSPADSIEAGGASEREVSPPTVDEQPASIGAETEFEAVATFDPLQAVANAVVGRQAAVGEGAAGREMSSSVEQAPTFEQGPGAGEEPTFEGTALPGQAPTFEPAVTTTEGHASVTGEVPPPVEAGGADVPLQATSPEELYTEAVVFAKYGLNDKAVAHIQSLLAQDPMHSRGRELLASLGGGEMAEFEFSQPQAAAAKSEAVREADDQLEAVEAVEARRSSVSQDRGRVPLGELEAILGVGQPGAADEAPAGEVVGFEATPEVGALAVEPEAQPSLEWSSDVQGASQVPASEGEGGGTGDIEPPALAAEAPEELVELVEVGDVLAGPSQEQLRELDFFIEQGLLEDAASQLEKLRTSLGDHPDLASRHALLKARGWEEVAIGEAESSADKLFSEEERFFDLAAELEQELADEDLVAEATGINTGAEASIEELFREFQKGVAEQLSEEDYDTHFNLGIAYREMGLLDEAIREFELASRSPELHVEAISMIGSSYLEQGLPEQALEWYARALEGLDTSSEVALGLKYEIGRAHEANGNVSSALAHYAEVLAINPGFRDVVERVEKLRHN